MIIHQLKLVSSGFLIFFLHPLECNQVLLTTLVLLLMQLLVEDKCLLQFLNQDILAFQSLSELLVLQHQELLLFNCCGCSIAGSFGTQTEDRATG